MTAPQKVSLSLFISVLAFAAFAVSAFSGLFDFIETRFYNPAVTRNVVDTLNRLAEGTAAYHDAADKRFKDILSKDFLKRSFLPNISSEDIANRNYALTKLQEDVPGLLYIRLIDQNGKRIHYSTLKSDIEKAEAVTISYKNYGDSGEEYPFSAVEAPDGKAPRILPSEKSVGGFIYSYPFYDANGIYKGTAVFGVSVSGLTGYLLGHGSIRAGESVDVLERIGIVLGIPQAAKAVFERVISERTASGAALPEILSIAETESGAKYELFSSSVGDSGIVGIASPSTIFQFPFSMKIILLASFFLTVYLLVFLLLNLRQDQMVVLSDRIKRFQINLLEGYLDNKGDIDWQRWQAELAQRRGEVKREIKRGIGRVRQNKEKQVDDLIDKSWDEILGIMGTKYEETKDTLDIRQLEEALKKVLGSGSIVLPVSSAVPSTAGTDQAGARRASRPPIRIEAQPVAPAAGEVEVLEEIESVEEVEAVSYAEAVEVLEEVESVEEAEVIPEAELAEEAEAIEVLEEAEAAEEIAEAEAVVVLEEAEAVEAAEAVPEAESAEESGIVSRYETPDGLVIVPLESAEEGEVVLAERVLMPLQETGAPRSDFVPSAIPPGTTGRETRTAAYLEELDTEYEDIPVIDEPIGIELADENDDVSDLIALVEMGMRPAETFTDVTLEFESPKSVRMPFGIGTVPGGTEAAAEEFPSVAGSPSAPLQPILRMPVTSEGILLDESSPLVVISAAATPESPSADRILPSLGVTTVSPDGTELLSLDRELNLQIRSLDLSGLEDFDEMTAESLIPEITLPIEEPEESVEDRADLKHLDGAKEISIISQEDVEMLEELSVFERDEAPVDVQPLKRSFVQYVPYFARVPEDFSRYRHRASEEDESADLEELAELIPAPDENAKDGESAASVGDAEPGMIAYEDGVYQVRTEMAGLSVPTGNESIETLPGAGEGETVAVMAGKGAQDREFRDLVDSVLEKNGQNA